MQPDRQESLQERGLLSSNSEQAVIVSGGILVIAKDAGSVWRCEEDTGLLFSPILSCMFQFFHLPALTTTLLISLIAILTLVGIMVRPFQWNEAMMAMAGVA